MTWNTDEANKKIYQYGTYAITKAKLAPVAPFTNMVSL